MPNTPTILSLFLLIGRISLSISLRPPLVSPEQDPCHRTNTPTTHLRSDQLTVLINGYSESRIPLLRSLAAAYSASPTVAAVLVLWGNPSTPSQTLAFLSHNLSTSASAAPISLLRQTSPSLNLRFLPRPSSIPTRAVLVCDDDVEIDPKSLDFAFKVWAKNPNRLVGFFARSHDIDLSRRGEWIYTVHPDKYSIILTKIMITKTEYLYKYSCRGGQEMAEARTVVDRTRNCEDILMNFVVAEEENAGPVLVGGEQMRDWGDARNEAGEEKEVGLSSRRRDHRRRRGECIREFHRIFGRMPLRYSYGKMVDSVGEQGLCDKGGKLVFCDRQV